MRKLGIFVGENNWTFFNEIFEDLSTHYTTTVFKPRIYNVPLLRGRLNGWAYRRGIQSILNSTDVCFFEWASDLLAVASHSQKKSKIVTRLHSFELYEWGPKINWDYVDKIIVLSEAMKRNFVELYQDQIRKIEIIHNGQSLTRFQSAETKRFTFTIGILGHIAPIKRVYEAILMIYDLVRDGYPALLRIGGNPADDYRYYVAVQNLVRRLDLQNHVIFDGFIEDTPGWLQTIDIYISNSYWEGQQVALLEAMASGCYCLAHFWSGAEEMLPVENLFVTNDELRIKIGAYSMKTDLERINLRNLLRTLAVERFDIEQTRVQIRRLVDTL
jgi:glycosyltransferase involved in cell wall biosynthesis